MERREAQALAVARRRRVGLGLFAGFLVNTAGHPPYAPGEAPYRTLARGGVPQEQVSDYRTGRRSGVRSR
jgi:hypothetical protein